MIGIYSARYRCGIMATDKIKVAVRVRPFNRRGMYYLENVSFFHRVSPVIVLLLADADAYQDHGIIGQRLPKSTFDIVLRSEYVLTVTFFPPGRTVFSPATRYGPRYRFTFPYLALVSLLGA